MFFIIMCYIIYSSMTGM